MSKSRARDVVPLEIAPRAEDIRTIVAVSFGATVKEIVSQQRCRPLARARMVAMKFTREMTPHSLLRVGKFYGGRDHSTILHAQRRIDDLAQLDRDFGRKVMEARDRIHILCANGNGLRLRAGELAARMAIARWAGNLAHRIGAYAVPKPDPIATLLAAQPRGSKTSPFARGGAENAEQTRRIAPADSAASLSPTELRCARSAFSAPPRAPSSLETHHGSR